MKWLSHWSLFQITDLTHRAYKPRRKGIWESNMSAKSTPKCNPDIRCLPLNTPPLSSKTETKLRPTVSSRVLSSASFRNLQNAWCRKRNLLDSFPSRQWLPPMLGIRLSKEKLKSALACIYSNQIHRFSLASSDSCPTLTHQKWPEGKFCKAG